jgi:hypothetical protein
MVCCTVASVAGVFVPPAPPAKRYTPKVRDNLGKEWQIQNHVARDKMQITRGWIGDP